MGELLLGVGRVWWVGAGGELVCLYLYAVPLSGYNWNTETNQTTGVNPGYNWRI